VCSYRLRCINRCINIMIGIRNRRQPLRTSPRTRTSVELTNTRPSAVLLSSSPGSFLFRVTFADVSTDSPVHQNTEESFRAYISFVLIYIYQWAVNAYELVCCSCILNPIIKLLDASNLFSPLER
jgi:hypothetical protein